MKLAGVGHNASGYSKSSAQARKKSHTLVQIINLASSTGHRGRHLPPDTPAMNARAQRTVVGALAQPDT
jgi:hypothetical protein